MVELIQEFAFEVSSEEDGQRYIVRAYGAPQAQSPLWDAWLVYFPDDDGAPLVGDRETTQQREDLLYWASGLEPVYLEGALERVVRAQHQDVLVRHEPWGAQAADLIEEEEIAYRIAHERLKMGRATAAPRPDVPPAPGAPPGDRHA